MSTFQSTHPSGVRPPLRGSGLAERVISIHAPQWGATTQKEATVTKLSISIHTPQWGATTTNSQSEWRSTHFNPRTPVGCNRRRLIVIQMQHQFQSTHPSGVRRSIGVNLFLQFDFNPRTPVGCDGGRRHVRTEGHISIHAPQWGATSGLSRPTRGRQYFNPRTPVGCDRILTTASTVGCNFNPRTPVGCDATCGSRRNRSNRFQSTHPSGVRRSCRCD